MDTCKFWVLIQASNSALPIFEREKNSTEASAETVSCVGRRGKKMEGSHFCLHLPLLPPLSVFLHRWVSPAEHERGKRRRKEPLPPPRRCLHPPRSLPSLPLFSKPLWFLCPSPRGRKEGKDGREGGKRKKAGPKRNGM